MNLNDKMLRFIITNDTSMISSKCFLSFFSSATEIVGVVDSSWDSISKLKKRKRFKTDLRASSKCWLQRSFHHFWLQYFFEFNSNSLTLNRINAWCYFYMFRSKGGKKNNRNEERIIRLLHASACCVLKWNSTTVWE